MAAPTRRRHFQGCRQIRHCRIQDGRRYPSQLAVQYGCPSPHSFRFKMAADVTSKHCPGRPCWAAMPIGRLDVTWRPPWPQPRQPSWGRPLATLAVSHLDSPVSHLGLVSHFCFPISHLGSDISALLSAILARLAILARSAILA